MGVYKWKEGSRYMADVELIAKELDSIPDLVPENIVQFARRENTELHKCFVWDDEKAAHMFRIEQARSVVQSIITVDESPGRETVSYRSFESVIVGDKRQYVPTRAALQDEDMRAQILGELGQSISELSRKAKTYRYLAEHELDTAQRHLDLAREAVTA